MTWIFETLSPTATTGSWLHGYAWWRLGLPIWECGPPGVPWKGWSRACRSIRAASPAAGPAAAFGVPLGIAPLDGGLYKTSYLLSFSYLLYYL